MTSKFFSGFSLKNEKEIFSGFLIENDFVISGFSYGAIKAFKETLNTNKRVDLLQLFSPAFFQDKDKKFKRMQLIFFKKDSSAYCDNFLNNIISPSTYNMSSFFEQGTYVELEELLTYEWNEDELQLLVDRGVKIEVYLGSEDKIVDSKKAKDFFVKYATVYTIKSVGHILQ